MKFSTNLKNAMDQAHMSQQELAAKSELSKTAVSQYLANKFTPKAATITKIATALGTTAEALTSKEEQEEAVSVDRISTRTAARCLGKSEQFVRIGLQRGLLPFGSAVPGTGKKYNYYINSTQFRDFAGPDHFDRFFGLERKTS